jgi:hypothetical protein
LRGEKAIFLCTSTPRATPLPEVTRRAGARGVEMWFIEELKEIRGVEVGVSFNCAICSIGLMKQIENHGVFVGVL